ncbi:MAG: TolC family protein [Stagnimonas sp.]|nr:TolC family protein [Stagnimonas sp.]
MPAARTLKGIAVLLCVWLTACASQPPAARPDAAVSLRAYEARQLDPAALKLPPLSEGWSLAQWFQVAQASSPMLAEMRARLALTQAGEITAAQRPNPTLNLSTEYIAAAAGMPAWLYGVAVDFLLQAAGSRDRAKAVALLQTQAASTDLADALWQLRSAVRTALVDATAAEAETTVLSRLIDQRARLLATARLRLSVGEGAAAEVLRAELDVATAHQRQQLAGQRLADARQRLASAVGVPVSAIADAPLRGLDPSGPAQRVAIVSQSDREAALLARPELLRALRETDLAELGVQTEVARRTPDVRVSPAYTWDHGVRKNQLSVGFPIPLFNRNEGPIAEALARRELAARHVLTVQAALFAQMESAERQWPVAQANWQAARANQQRLARLTATERKLLAEGAGDRPSLLAAETAEAEAALLTAAAALDAQRAFAALEDAYRKPFAEQPTP